MKKALASLVILGALASGATGCGYAGVAAVGQDKVVVLRNDAFLFGALRKAVVCKVGELGLASCAAQESP